MSGIKTDPAENPEGAAGHSSEETTSTPETEVEDKPEGTPETGADGESEDAPETEVEGKPEGEPEGSDEKYEVSFDDEDPSPKSPKGNADWTRMRLESQKNKQRIAELERQIAASKTPAGAPPEPGEEPTLEDCGWDQDELKKRTREHDAKVAKRNAWNEEQKKIAEAAAQKSKALTEGYQAKKAVFSKKVAGYQEAEDAVCNMLGGDAQDVLLKVAKKPEELVYALGRRPDLLEKLAKETDRDMFVAELKTLEARIKVEQKNTPTQPEEKVRGSGAPGPDGTTEAKLRAKGDESNDYAELHAWKRKQKKLAEEAERKKRR